ncbi:MAG: S1C family serine protease [Candidatus Puniceispirillaceae bacterium]
MNVSYFARYSGNLLIMLVIWLAGAASGFADHGPHSYQAIASSVVKILPTWPGYGRPGFGAPDGTAPEGSGFYLAPDMVSGTPSRFIITSAHVVSAATRVEIQTAGRREDAAILLVDELRDIAILEAVSQGPSVAINTVSPPAIGRHVCALGNPFGLGNSFSCGVVSAVNRQAGFQQIEDFIQIDAAINPGMSGGALINGDGELLGMINAIFTKQADIDAGVNFAISNKLLLETLSNDGSPFCRVENRSELLTNCPVRLN